MWPNLPDVAALSYLGIFFLIFGIFLLIAGSGIISIEKISVKPGRATLLFGIFLMVIGFLFLMPEIRSISSLPTSITTPTRVGLINPPSPTLFPTPTSSPSETPTLIASPTTEVYTITPCANSSQLLQVNRYARVVTASDPLLLRPSPGNVQSSIEKLRPQTQVYVLDGPVCEKYYANFFWWWKVQAPSGNVGWIPEGSDTKDPIFISPVP